MTDAFADMRVNAFFGGVNANRLRTCLTRLMCSIQGPCKYGQEVDGEPEVSRATPCRSVLAAHANIRTPRAITSADFDAMVSIMVGVLDRAAVPAPERDAVLGALSPMCKDIVPGGTGCR
jgi:hypothetical protein